ncbi:MAG: sigma-70 family RNA polymerase sigma factor [Bacteroidetes bacterium]|nr:sigma-70 family RNA polymerase sigma factor [Bacteroidota bacterium]
MKPSIEEIWAIHGPKIAEYICQKTNHQDHCHDLLQDVYLKVQKHVAKIEKAQNMLPYILRMAHNVVNDYYRAKPTTAVIDDSAMRDCCSAPAMDHPNARLADNFLKELIDSLPTLYRHALVRTELEGISQKQLAAELGISYSGAKSRVQRAKEMIRQSIIGCCGYQFDRYGNVISCCGSDV